MKQVISHGYLWRERSCPTCKCHFLYTKDEVELRLDGSSFVTCPECLGVVMEWQNKKEEEREKKASKFTWD